jgi:hypothetical protein
LTIETSLRSESATQHARDRSFRILTFDGGGVKGTFSASFLATGESISCKRIADYFDLIAGTSTGGIIALCLGLGFTAKEILELYLNHGGRIFPATGIRGRFRHLLRYKHSPDALQEVLRAAFGSRRLGESTSRLVIPAFDAVAGDVKLFKTAHHPRFKLDSLLPAWEVALATSAAPTFFPAHKQILIDGGVWANNPVAVAIIEAIGILEVNPRRIEVLSIGTTSEPYHVSGSLRISGRLRWMLPISTLLLHAQQAGSMGLGHAITEHGKRLVRIDEKTVPGRFRLDDARGIGDLVELGKRAAAHSEKNLSPRFLDSPAPPFVPYHAVDGDSDL